jgi:hypothetical protein
VSLVRFVGNKWSIALTMLFLAIAVLLAMGAFEIATYQPSCATIWKSKGDTPLRTDKATFVRNCKATGGR